MDEKIAGITKHLQDRFPSAPVEAKPETPDQFRFRIGDVPPAMFLDLEYEFVKDSSLSEILRQLGDHDLEALFPETGTVKFRVSDGRINKV